MALTDSLLEGLSCMLEGLSSLADRDSLSLTVGVACLADRDWLSLAVGVALRKLNTEYLSRLTLGTPTMVELKLLRKKPKSDQKHQVTIQICLCFFLTFCLKRNRKSPAEVYFFLKSDTLSHSKIEDLHL